MDIKAMLLEKQEKTGKKLVMKDVNRGLVTALLAIPVYGKEARDEEILSVIINAGMKGSAELMNKIRENYKKFTSEHKVKKQKDVYLDDEGYMVLVPKG